MLETACFIAEKQAPGLNCRSLGIHRAAFELKKCSKTPRGKFRAL
jgi:hypothetical protein